MEGHRVYPSVPESEKTNEFIRRIERERETSGSKNEFIGKTTNLKQGKNNNKSSGNIGSDSIHLFTE